MNNPVGFVGFGLDVPISGVMETVLTLTAPALKTPWGDPKAFSDCRWVKKISPTNLMSFGSRSDAVASGRRPCKTCNP